MHIRKSARAGAAKKIGVSASAAKAVLIGEIAGVRLRAFIMRRIFFARREVSTELARDARF
ncbi:MAG TPA: hypothetical protein VKS78_19915, partial [Roseiarcus sp.]|nr:hypothetical protein [Roseiarcus sp.]